MKKKAITWLTVLALAVAGLSAGGVNERLIGVNDGGVVPSAETAAPESTEQDITEILYSVGNVYSFLEKNFLYDIDSREMEEALLTGLVSGLGDEYSYYVPEEKMKENIEEVTGEYVGIGTYVSKMNPRLMDPMDPETYMLQIISPFPGGPADRAGLLPGDLISHINGEDLTPLDAFEASRKLRGTKGEPLLLNVLRGKTMFELSVIPEEVIEPSTAYTMLENDIGYLSIQTFKDHTDEAVLEALSDMRSRGMRKLIIDLRFNGGGLVDTCLQILDYLLPRDSIMLTVKYSENSGRPGVTYKTSGNPVIAPSVPMVILINEGSASASEIMTGALRDNGRATLIGTKSFGKGIIQEQIPYKGGAINVTCAKYLTPSGDEIHKKGIEPDIEVLLPEYSEDETLAYAELSGDGKHREWVDMHPEYTQENIKGFCDEYGDRGIPEVLLEILVQKEYIHRMPAAERPVVDLKNDTQLLRAIEELTR